MTLDIGGYFGWSGFLNTPANGPVEVTVGQLDPLTGTWIDRFDYINTQFPGIINATHFMSGVPFRQNEEFNVWWVLNANLHLRKSPYLEGYVRSVQADFRYTAKITGIEVRNAAGQVLEGWKVRNDSGAIYTPNGITAVPEPSSFAFALLALCGMLGHATACRARVKPMCGSPAPMQSRAVLALIQSLELVNVVVGDGTRSPSLPRSRCRSPK